MSWKQDQIICSWNLISTLTVHWWYIKEAFAAFCRQFLKEKENSEAILVAGCFHLNWKFSSKSPSGNTSAVFRHSKARISTPLFGPPGKR